MKKDYSSSWKNSKQTRKQKKYRFNSPLHIKQKFVTVHLSQELRKKYNTRNLMLHKGDKIKVLCGQYKKTTGTVESVDLKKQKVIISGVEITKKDGTKTTLGIHPSNLIITELKLDDKKRQKIIERKSKK